MCPVCESSKSTFLAYSVIAPWILELISDDRNRFPASEYRRCNSCLLEYFTHRYSEEEMNSLYSNYRNQLYFEVRHKWEPWFTKSSMNSFDPDVNPDAVNSRKSFMQKFLDLNNVNLNELNNVLDFGGDLGQFFPENVAGKRFLFDPSEEKTKDSQIIRVNDLGLLKGSVGLVMNCHTLEHLPYPKKTVEQLATVLSDNGVLFIEVPFDKFKVSKFHKTAAYKKYLKFVSSNRMLFILIDFFSGLYRLKFRSIPFFGIVKQSEHINYFSKHSLEKLVDFSTLKYVGLSDPDLGFGQGVFKLGRIALVARRSD